MAVLAVTLLGSALGESLIGGALGKGLGTVFPSRIGNPLFRPACLDLRIEDQSDTDVQQTEETDE